MHYTVDHEWLRLEGDLVVVGITEHASEQLGDVVFVELPEVGRVVAAGDEVSVIESVKAASDILSPLAGEVVEVNGRIAADPSLINADPMRAWFFKLKVAELDLSGFMDETAYKALIG